MPPKIIAIVINCICLVTILIPILKELSTQGRVSIVIVGIVIVIVFIFGSAIINLVFATMSKTRTACAVNSFSAVVFASWFWFINNDIHEHPDAQSAIAYVFVTPVSLIVMIPLWFIWSRYNNPKKTKDST